MIGQRLKISREIEQAFCRYRGILLQISESWIIVGNLLKLNLVRLKGIKAFETISITFKKETDIMVRLLQ